METKGYKISDSVFLVSSKLESEEIVKVDLPVNHIIVIDCSGSMHYDLHKIREQLKQKLPKLLNKDDSVSIVWFSGRGQFGTLIESELVSTLSDLQSINKSIDRWLKSVGLTGFKEPIEEVGRLVERITKKRPGTVFSLFFMSDGHDNCWNRQEILETIKKSKEKLSSSVFVEYGYYADRMLLTSMAEQAGGVLIFSEDFNKYAPTFESIITKRVNSSSKIEFKVSDDVIGNFVYAIDGNDIITFVVENGISSIPDSIDEVFYVSKTCSCEFVDSVDQSDLGPFYAALSLYSVRMLPDTVLPLLKFIGDVTFIEKFSGLFGKQKYSEFMEEAKEAAFDPNKRFLKGCDPDLVPPDDAFTILDLLGLISSSDSNFVLLDDPNFKYNKIGRGRIDVTTQLSNEERKAIDDITSEMSETKDPKKLKDLADRISSITKVKKDVITFEPDCCPGGYSISNLTYNEDRPNVSILVRKSGSIDLSTRLKDGEYNRIPRKFSSFIFRNYTVIKDGLVNISKLPVSVNKDTYDLLCKSGIKFSFESENSDNHILTLDLSSVPVINRKMVKSVSAKDLFEKDYELTKLRACQKVYNSVKKEKFPRKSEGFSIIYGDDSASWLKEQGITDYSGYQPSKTNVEESTDFYVGKELKTSLKGLSSLPTLKKAEEAISKNKLTPSVKLMQPAIEEINKFLSSNTYSLCKNPESLFESWLDSQLKSIQLDVRKLILEIAKIKFTIIVGQTWFTEFDSMNDNSLSIDVDGESILCKVEAREVNIPI